MKLSMDGSCPVRGAVRKLKGRFVWPQRRRDRNFNDGRRRWRRANDVIENAAQEPEVDLALLTRLWVLVIRCGSNTITIVGVTAAHIGRLHYQSRPD